MKNIVVVIVIVIVVFVWFGGLDYTVGFLFGDVIESIGEAVYRAAKQPF